MIRRIEELSYNAWPAFQTVHIDGWIARFANGYTRRANSVNPIYPSEGNVLDKIRYCEALYSARGLDTVFKMTEAAQPADLDSLLAREGYTRQAQTSVHVLDLRSLEVADESYAEDISTYAEVADEWLGAYFKATRLNDNVLPIMRQLLGNVVVAPYFVAIREAGHPVSFGLGVREQGYVGLFDILTDSDYRNRGYGSRVVRQILAWGKAQGATTAYLQVMDDNATALRLYARMGFREVYKYWYRVKSRR